MLDFAGLDELLNGTGELFDRHLRVDPVLVVEVDGVDAEPLQRPLDGAPELTGQQHAPKRLAFDGIDVLRELGRDDDLAAERAERLADKFFVGVRSVDLRGVEEGYAAPDGGTDEGDHLVAVGVAAVPSRHGHASQPDGRDLQTADAELSFLHAFLLTRERYGRAGARSKNRSPRRSRRMPRRSKVATRTPNTATAGSTNTSPVNHSDAPLVVGLLARISIGDLSFDRSDRR